MTLSRSRAAFHKSGVEAQHPSIGSRLVALLTEDGRIDPELRDRYHEFCGVNRSRPSDWNDVGHLFRRAEGPRAFRDDVTRGAGDATNGSIASDRRAAGGHASICDGTGPHVYAVASIEPI